MWWMWGLGGLGALAGARSLSSTVSSSLGIALPSWLTGTQANQSAYDVGKAAAAQVARATAGSALSSYKNAEDIQLFLNPGTFEGIAWLKTAWWLAVAARCLKDAGLARAAAVNLAKGSALSGTVGGLVEGDPAGAYRSALTKLQYVGKKLEMTGDPNYKAVAKALGFQGSDQQIEAQKQVNKDKEVVLNTLQKSGEDVATGAQVLRGLWSGEKPPGMSDTKWFLYKWGLRLLVLGGIGGGIYLYTAPTVRQAGKEAKRLATTAKEMVTEAHAKFKRGAEE